MATRCARDFLILQRTLKSELRFPWMHWLREDLKILGREPTEPYSVWPLESCEWQVSQEKWRCGEIQNPWILNVCWAEPSNTLTPLPTHLTPNRFLPFACSQLTFA